MKNYKYYIVTILFLSLATQGCKKFLEEDLYSQLAPENFLTTQEGLESVLFASYAFTANMLTNNSVQNMGPEEYTTDIMIQTGDTDEATTSQYINFTFHPALNYLTVAYDPRYQAIRNANIVFENADLAKITDAQKKLFKAESRFLRAVNYYKLYLFFGPVPLRTSTTQEPAMAKATDAEMKSFIESELLAVLPDLPDAGKEIAYGRAHKGAVLGFLAKFYLNTKQWQKAADFSKQLMDLNTYRLYDVYTDMFKVENERNPENIWVKPAKASADRRNANSWANVSFPINFAKDPKSGLVFKNTWVNFPNEHRILDAFYNSFEVGDVRKDLIISEYVDNAGKTISLLNDNNTRSFKYWPDPNAAGASHGNDIPEIRYADILLARAEALNELNGVNQESVNLINMVRIRAKLAVKTMANFPSKELLKDHILKERGWEFYGEGQRRQDLIRMDKFISFAIARGRTNAKPFHVRFPFPEVAITGNPKLIQNEGY